MPETLLLMPAPRRMVLAEESCPLLESKLIWLDFETPASLLFSAKRFQQALRARHGLVWEAVAGDSAPRSAVGLTLQVRAEMDIPDQGYELSISTQGIWLQARDLAGAFYGVCTLAQIVEQSGRSLPCLRITDWPDFPARGVMLDVSRERVPRMETLYALVDLLAGWKINQLQLYTEHAFAYRQHAPVWENVSPITGQEVMELDEYCRERFIELVPNQQSFGHLAPWLNHPDYKSLAEVADGFQTPWGFRAGSFSLCPTDARSLEFLRGLYAELLPHFSSRMFNVGCDETFDLGQGRSQADCQRLGKERVYLNFLLEITREVKRFGRTPQFWGDIIVDHPELIAELPKDILALEWGYEAQHPFDLHGTRFAASGIPFYVCPGTSSWCSIAGRSDNAVGNLLNAAENGLKHGAVGYLITDWGDYGHWQVWPVSYLGLMTGAAYAWALDSNRDMDVARMLSWHAFRDASGVTGAAAFALGNVYRAVGMEPHNSSMLFKVMQWPLDQIRATEGLSMAVFEQAAAAVEAAASLLDRSQMDHPDGELMRDEFRLTADLLRHACQRGMLAFANDPVQAARLRRDLDSSLAQWITEFRRVWLMRNRAGGLAESTARLERLREDYVPAESLFQGEDL